MNYVELEPFSPGSEEWKQQRRLGVGSSDAPIVCLGEWWGLSPFDLWLDKVHGVEQSMNNSMAMGSIMEDVIARLAAERERWEIAKMPAIRSIADPWRQCNIDRVILNRGRAILEVKKSRNGAGWGNGAEDIPSGVYIQVQHQLDVYGGAEAFVAVLIAGEDLRTYEIAARPDLQAKIRDAERRFWDLVESREPPPVTTDVGHLLDSMFPPKAGSRVTAEPFSELSVLAAQYAIAAHETKVAGREYRRLDDIKKVRASMLKKAMGASILEIADGRRVEQRTAKVGRIDLKLFGFDLEDEDGE